MAEPVSMLTAWAYSKTKEWRHEDEREAAYEKGRADERARRNRSILEDFDHEKDDWLNDGFKDDKDD